jgi:hypothetical protein
MTSNNEMVCSLLPSGDSNAVKQVEAQTQSDRIEQMPSDTQRQVEALALKLDALDVYAQTREAEVTASVILSLIERMKSDAPLPKHCAQCEANAYAVLGGIALNKGTKESVVGGMACIDKARAVLEAINDAEDASDAIKGLALVKSIFEGYNSESLLKGLAFKKSLFKGGKETLKAAQEAYELCVVQNEEDEVMIKAGIIYATHLAEANRNAEAIEIMTKLLATHELQHGYQEKMNQLLQLMNIASIW